MDEILAPLTEILEGVLQADRQLLEKTKAKVFSAFITVLQMQEMRGEGQRRWQPGRSGAELDVPPVGFEFLVLELWSLGKLFFFPPVSPPLS